LAHLLQGEAERKDALYRLDAQTARQT
jgi:hypothetical protein